MKPDCVRYYAFFLFLLGFHTHALSQLSSLHFRHLNTSDGLSDNRVNAICQDKEGFLWIGTLGGLNRYDGKHFTVFRHSYTDNNSIANNICLGLCLDSSDNIWVRSSYSISCYNRQSGTFTNYFYKDSNGKTVTINEFFTGIMIMRDGHVLLSSQLFGFLEVDELHHRLVPKYFQGIPASVDNKNKFFTVSGAICYRTDSSIYASNDDRNHFFKIMDQKNLPSGIPISALGLADVTGSRYCFSDARSNIPASIILSDLASHTVTIVHLTGTFMMSLNHYDSNTWWIGFWGSGLVKYDRRMGRSVHYMHYKNDASTVSNDLIRTLFTDKDKNLWIGTEDGIDFCNPGKDKVFMVNKTIRGFEKLDISEVETMAEDDSDKIWIGLLDYNSGATNGLIRFDPVTSTYKSFTALGTSLYGIWHILPEGDHLLLSTQNGLAEFNLKTETVTRKFEQPFPQDVLSFDKGFTILQKDHSGNYWFGFWRKGLLKFNAKTKESTYFNVQENDKQRQLSDDLVYSLTVDDSNNVWAINLINNVLEFINNKTNEVTHIPVNFNGQPFTDKFQCIVSDKSGHIWIGTNGGGLIMYDTGSHHFNLFSTDNGLPDLSIRGLRIDDQNRLWILTSTGLVWMDPLEKRIHSIDNNNLQFSGINGDEPLLLTRNRYLYIGSANGFFYFNPDDVLLSEKISQPIPITFKKTNLYQYIPPSQKELKVFPGEENISVSYVSLNMTQGNEINYAFRLKGYDDAWQENGNEGIAKFAKLPPGKYELQMRATFRGMKWNGKYSSISLTVIPAFYQTWWFRSIIFLLAALAVTWFIYSASTRRLRKKIELLNQQQQINNLRNRIANDIHDEIGAGLTRISIRSELARQDKRATKNDYLNVLQNINSQSYELVNSLGEIVWTIDPQHDKLDSMLAYFRHYINKFMEGLPLKYSIHFPESVPEVVIHPDIKRNLFLILKEAVNNSVKHAQANTLHISFEINKQHYLLKVADDGIGICDEETHQFGNGIKSMKNRTSIIHATFTIQSDPLKGTIINVKGDFYDPV